MNSLLALCGTMPSHARAKCGMQHCRSEPGGLPRSKPGAGGVPPRFGSRICPVYSEPESMCA
eukprot:10575957-Lingulodinium_polyedra.AAC.1